MAARIMATTDDLRSRINVKTKGMQKDSKKQWMNDLIAHFAPGHHRLNPQQFVAALSSLGIDPRSAESMFREVDAGGDGYVDFHELNAVATGFKLDSQSARSQLRQDDRGLLRAQSYGADTSRDMSRTCVGTSLQEQQQKEAKAFMHKIGTRLQDKGFKNLKRVMMALDPDDSGELTRDEMSRFFYRHLGYANDYSNRFFTLLDRDDSGTVLTKDLARRLEPYLQKGFGCASHALGEWHEEEAPSPSSNRGNNMAATMPPAEARAMDSLSNSMHQLHGSNSRPAGVGSNAGSPMSSRRSSCGVVPGMDGADGTGSTAFPGSPSSRRSGGGCSPSPQSPLGMPPAGFSSARSNASSQGSRGGYPGSPMQRSPSSPTFRQPAPPSPALGRRPSNGNAGRRDPTPAGPPLKVDMSELVLGEFRKLILKRGGSHGIQALGRTFMIMDTNKNQLISNEELEIGMGRFGLHMKPNDLQLLMKAVDKNGTGTISYDEFMVAIRGQINERRQKLIMMAFATLDKTGNGLIDSDDVADNFDANHHPEVMAGNMHPKQALGDFLSQFDCLDLDNCITKKEFLEYYKNVSASIDNDDYFELMIRNAWHIAGGSGWCANTSNKRILVTFNDGSQKVVCLEHDMGQDLRNHAVVQKMLDQQGVRNVRSWKLTG